MKLGFNDWDTLIQKTEIKLPEPKEKRQVVEAQYITTYIRVGDEAINDGGESASYRKSVTCVSTNGSSYPCRDYHYARVLPP